MAVVSCITDAARRVHWRSFLLGGLVASVLACISSQVPFGTAQQPIPRWTPGLAESATAVPAAVPAQDGTVQQPIPRWTPGLAESATAVPAAVPAQDGFHVGECSHGRPDLPGNGGQHLVEAELKRKNGPEALAALKAWRSIAAELPQRASKQERDFFAKWTQCTVEYMEWGCGGSTASIFQKGLQLKQIHYVDSVPEWLAKVRVPMQDFQKRMHVLEGRGSAVELVPKHVDLGALGAWGYPLGEPQPFWRKYAQVLENSTAFHSFDGYPLYWPDTVFVDGRFRVSCFLETVLYFVEHKAAFLAARAAAGKPGIAAPRLATHIPNNGFFNHFRSEYRFPVILWHDFMDRRKAYGAALEFADIHSFAETMVVLKVHSDMLDPSPARLAQLRDARERFAFIKT